MKPTPHTNWLTNFTLRRHSREGGNPCPQKSLFLEAAQRCLRSWIPAFAGMTESVVNSPRFGQNASAQSLWTTRRQAACAILFMPLTTLAQAPEPPTEVAREISQARLQGKGAFSYFGLAIYDAKLWVGSSFNKSTFDQHELALELQYRRSLDGEKIAEKSLSEIQKQGAVNADVAKDWLAQMTQAFPNVKNGDRITGIYKPGESAVFYFNGQRRLEVRDAEFARRFFGIWLSPRSSAPQLRQALLSP
jgi:hypothetical protein